MINPIRILFLLAGLGIGFAALAQSAPPDESDPPTRVARLSYLDGAVSFVPAGENDWVEADLNRPLISGDRLWTDRDSRAVLELGDASIRMDQRTSFDFLNLDDRSAQVELTQGTLNLRVRRLYDGQSYEIDTPTLAFVVDRVGEFRIDVAPDGDSTMVTVRSGGGDVYGEDNARFQVEEGQSVVFYNPRLTDYEVNDLPAPDQFDDFCYERDRRWDDSPSRRYVSEEVIGYQDLDRYGDWQDVADYGYVWYPTSVAAGWAPYRFGHWAWVGLYGWTWIDDSPWGFAPFHYGRWAFIRGRWGWCPGPRTVRPVYAPALVAFVGGVGVSISSGPIGWFPLGRGDIYFPPYHVSRRYFTRLNEHDTHIRRERLDHYYGRFAHGDVDYAKFRYANRNVRNALTAVPARAFVDARPVAKAAIRVKHATFANAHVHGFARLAPTRASLARTRRARARPAAAVFKRHIVAATRPPAPIAGFSAHRAALLKNPGRPLSSRQLRTTAPARAARHDTKTPNARPRMRIVTHQGLPLRTRAPALPKHVNPARNVGHARPAAPGRPTQRQVPRRETPPVRRIEKNRPTQKPSRPVNSSRFAQPSPAAPQRARPTQKPSRPVNSPRFAQPSSSAPQRARPTQRGERIKRDVGQPHKTPTPIRREQRLNQAPARPRGNPQPRLNRAERNVPQRPTYRRVEPQVHARPAPQRQPTMRSQPAPRPMPRVERAPQRHNVPAQSRGRPQGHPPQKKSDDDHGHGHGHGHPHG